MKWKQNKNRERLSPRFTQGGDQDLSPQEIYLDKLSTEHDSGWGDGDTVLATASQPDHTAACFTMSEGCQPLKRCPF